MEDSRVPVTVLTGFLGAGKTTLLNRLLVEQSQERLAVLVNEFGDVPVDGRLVVRTDEELIELSNGCICCSIRGDLVSALTRLLQRRKKKLFARPFDRLVIETSGLASPGVVLQTLLIEPELEQSTRAAGVVALAHAALIADQLEEHDEVEEQIGYADIVLLNHADRADTDQLDAAEAAIRARNATARLLRTERARVPTDLVLGALHVNAPAIPAQLDHQHTHGATTVVLRSERLLDLARLKMWLQFLASKRDHELWRVKGLLACENHEQAVVVQGVYQFLELGPADEGAPQESLLVLIGRGLDEAELQRGWHACHPA